MKQTITIVILLTLMLQFSFHAQSDIETFSNGFSVKLDFNEPFHNDIKNDLVIIRDYPDYTDVDAAGHFKLPSKTFLVAIPQFSKPFIRFENVQTELIRNTIPEIQPKVKKVNDSTIVYEKIEFDQAIITDDYSEMQILGYIWYREYYCAVVKINTHKFDNTNRQIKRIKAGDLKIEFDMNYPVDFNNISLNTSDNISIPGDLVINSQIAQNFAAKQPLLLSDTTGNWINYGYEYLKIGTAKDELVRITKSDLETMGINVSQINPGTFQLFESSVEIPITVFGEEDSVFNDDDYIQFYGTLNYPKISHRIINQPNQPYNEYLNRYSDTTFYFLTWNKQNGLRIPVQTDYVNGLSDSLKYYRYFEHVENNILFQNCYTDEVENQTPGWLRNKTWYFVQTAWFYSNTTRNYNFNVIDVVPNKLAKFFYKAVSFGSDIVYDAHQLTLKVNSVLIDSQSINRNDQVLLSGQLNTNQLSANPSVMTIKNHANSSSSNAVVPDWYDVEYPRYLKLDSDFLLFTVDDDVSSGLKTITVDNPASSTFEIYKVKPSFKKITGYQINSGKLLFTDTVNAGDRYIISEVSKIGKPVFYYKKQFVNLRSKSEQTDYLAITHPKFISSAQSYVNLISSIYNVTANLISVEDIFDEFGFGYPTPESIRLFNAVTYQNKQSPKPQYLTIIGDANYDYKLYRFKSDGVKGGGNFVPGFGNPISDNWFAVWNPDTLPIPQMKVGRIPINTSEELDYYLSKVQNNFNQRYNEWNKEYMFFSGGRANEPGEIAQLKAANDQVINNHVKPAPLAGSYTHFYKTSEPMTDFGPYTPEEISRKIDAGGVFISYIGHSGTATWDNSINETTQLKNKVNRNPLITDFGCSTNKFAEPDILSFGERFLFNSDGQAIGYIGNSSLGFTSTSLTLPIYFYGEIINSTDKEVGASHLLSKIKMFNNLGTSTVFRLFALTNTLLGDPVLRIKIPDKPNLNISEADVIFNNNFINDAIDSVKVDVIINNFGIKDTSMFNYSITHIFNGNVQKNYSYRRSLPSFKDTLSVWIFTKGLAGENVLTVNLDPNNEVNEIYEDDNNLTFHFYVYSTELRDIVKHRIENPELNSIKILNPSLNSIDPFQIRYQISETESFLNPVENTISSDSFFTLLNLSGLQNNKRYYFRYKMDEAGSSYSGIKSFYNKNNSDFLLNDSVSFANQVTNDLEYKNEKLSIEPEEINISVTSAGFEAGKTCVIAKNGINLLSNTFFAGIGIVVFDDVTFEIDTSTWFTLFNQPANVEALAVLIDSIPDGKIVAMGVSSDAANNMSAHLRNAIISLGSTKITELQYRSSWALIGKKGAVPGEVIEEVRGRYDGLIYIDTTFVIPKKEGTLETAEIGPSSDWQYANFEQTIPSGCTIQHFVYGIKSDLQIDSLGTLNLTNNTAALDFINPEVYPKIKIKSYFNANTEGVSPELLSLGIDYTGLSEIGTNYQVIEVNKDTVLAGENVNLTFWIYNIGEAKADSFDVVVSVFNSNNNLDTSYRFNSVSISAGGKLKFDVSYTPYGSDTDKKFFVLIDPDNRVKEYFKDNNFFTKSFYVQRDIVSPAVKITFDDAEVIYGDFVSNKPDIKIALSDDSPIPITDTSAVKIYLNEMPVYYGVTQNNISYSTSPDNPKFIANYKPELEDGDYLLRVVGKDLSGNIADSASSEVYFVVSSETKLHQVYNYPNPFSEETYFTFRLSQIPQEIKIKIYTIAGRLIKEIVRNSSELNYDLNKILWNGRDEDGDIIANGTYIYKVFIKNQDKVESVTQKLVIVK